MIEQHRITDRASWLALRQKDITASVAGALLGVHEYQTPYSLWALKTGLLQEDSEETAPMRRGRLLEPVALQLIREERPTWALKQYPFYWRDPDCRLGATPDALATCPERGLGVVQVKTVEPSIFRQKWRGEAGDVEPPLWIAVQAMVEAHLSGAKWACVAAVMVNHGIDVAIIDVPIHAGVLAKLHSAVRDFWRMVEANEPPPPDFARDGDVIRQLFGNASDPEPLDLSGDNLLPALLDQRDQLSLAKNAAEKRLKEIDAEILHKLGDHVAGRCADGRLVTAKTVHRKAYEVKASSYRSIRIATPKGE